MSSLQHLIKTRTGTFMKKELNSDRTSDTPLIKIYKLCEAKRTKGFLFLKNIMNQSTQQDISIVDKLRTLDSSKVRTYKEINPELSVHPVYTSKDYINERERLSFTRFRLSSHHLKIETGRWARIDVENRVCDCGNGLQDERHALFLCERTENERIRFNVGRRTIVEGSVEETVVEGSVEGSFEGSVEGTLVAGSVGELMKGMNVHELVSFVHCCMAKFK